MPSEERYTAADGTVIEMWPDGALWRVDSEGNRRRLVVCPEPDDDDFDLEDAVMEAITDEVRNQEPGVRWRLVARRAIGAMYARGYAKVYAGEDDAEQ